ncbi:MAG: hypothetical protein GWM88_05440 [Pseudomonadales bacterium]|nr:hypothetical protein [Pseudomonadales bacterium]NIX07479.1 hypothetical protein [Pseudomonadales bacterium]
MMMTWGQIFATYLVIGGTVLLFTPVRPTLARHLNLYEQRHISRLAFAVYAGIVVASDLLLWPFLAATHRRSRRRVKPEHAALDPELLEEQKTLRDSLGQVDDGVDGDELPDATGDFGRVASNPIPCNTIFGSTAYLARLRSSDGAKILFDRLGSVSSEASAHPVDCYAIKHPDGRGLGVFYISPYQKRNSRKAPDGFSIN